MNNPNIKRNIRNLSVLALALLGAGAIKATKTADTHPNPTNAPIIKPYRLQEIFNGETVFLDATIKPGKPGDHIESASFSLADPDHVPAGVGIRNNKMTTTKQGEELTAELTAPSNPHKPESEIEVEVAAAEANGATSTVEEKILSEVPPPIPR